MNKFTGILLIFCLSIYLDIITSKQSDEKETLEQLIDDLFDDDDDNTFEVNEVSRDLIQTNPHKDFQAGTEKDLNDESIVRAIEMFLKSKRARKGKEKYQKNTHASGEDNFKRGWITADVVHKGTNGTTSSTTITTPPPKPRTTPPPRKPKTCFWIWFRRICF